MGSSIKDKFIIKLYFSKALPGIGSTVSFTRSTEPQRNDAILKQYASNARKSGARTKALIFTRDQSEPSQVIELKRFEY